MGFEEFEESMRSFHEGLFETLKFVFVGGTQPSSYECTDCDHEFEATAEHPSDAECPECGGAGIGTREE